MINHQEVMIGSHKLIKEFELTNPYKKEYDKLLAEAKTVNFIIVDGQVKALYAVRDELKPTSKLVINEMKKRGLKPYMITGDNDAVARAIAKELGIETYYSEVYPDQKANIIKDIQKQGHMTAFVGDGINDAPALKVADVGFAMGHGTDVAIDSSDVTLMSYDLGLVIKAIDMSKATLRNIYQNFGWAFSYNLVAIPLAATGRLSMVVAAAAMAFSSITVVLNALRLKATKLPEFTIKGGQTMTLTVTNMTCNHCKMNITKALNQKGITDITVDLDAKTVTLDPNDLTETDVKDIIQAIGYDVK
jgi:Cu+-exporting ATPase